MRPIIVCGNWKMNGLPNEAGPLAAAIAVATDVPDVVRILCPPYVSLAAVRDALAGSGVATGAQDVHAEMGGAYTGGVSAQMLTGLADWCIVGHSERRRDQGETGRAHRPQAGALRGGGVASHPVRRRAARRA